MKVLKSIDMFGKPFNFKFGDRDTYNTFYGGIATILLLLSTAIALMYFGKDMIYRSAPITSTNVYSGEIGKPHAITNDNFFYAVRLQYDNNVLFDDPRYFNYVFHYEKWNNTAKAFKSIESSYLKNCTTKNVKNKTVLELKEMDEFKCADFKNYTVGGSYSEVYHIVKVSIEKCNEKSAKEFDVTCASEADYLALPYLYIATFRNNPIYDPRNNTVPVKPYYWYHTYNFAYGIHKTTQYIYNPALVKTDNSSLWEDYKYFEFYEFKELENQAVIRDPKDDTVFNAIFAISDIVHEYHRRYVKMAQVLSEVGGILGICYKALVFIVAILILPDYHLFLINDLFRLNIEEANQEDFDRRGERRNGIMGLELGNLGNLADFDIGNKSSSKSKSSSGSKSEKKSKTKKKRSQSKKSKKNEENLENNMNLNNFETYEPQNQHQNQHLHKHQPIAVDDSNIFVNVKSEHINYENHTEIEMTNRKSKRSSLVDKIKRYSSKKKLQEVTISNPNLSKFSNFKEKELEIDKREQRAINNITNITNTNDKSGISKYSISSNVNLNAIANENYSSNANANAQSMKFPNDEKNLHKNLQNLQIIYKNEKNDKNEENHEKNEENYDKKHKNNKNLNKKRSSSMGHKHSSKQLKHSSEQSKQNSDDLTVHNNNSHNLHNLHNHHYTNQFHNPDLHKLIDYNKKQRTRVEFGYFKVFKFLYFSCCYKDHNTNTYINPTDHKNNLNYDIFSDAVDKLNMRLDTNQMLKGLDQARFVKKLLLNENQLFMLDNKNSGLVVNKYKLEEDKLKKESKVSMNLRKNEIKEFKLRTYLSNYINNEKLQEIEEGDFENNNKLNVLDKVLYCHMEEEKKPFQRVRCKIYGEK